MRITASPEVVAIVVHGSILEGIIATVVVVTIEVTIHNWDVPSTDIVPIIDITAIDSVVTTVRIAVKPHVATIKVKRVVGGIVVVTIRLPEDITLRPVCASVTKHDREVVQKKPIILKPALDNVCAIVRMAANDKALTVEQNVVVKYVVSAVKAMAHRVSVHDRTAVDKSTVVDISVMNAVVAVVHCAVNDDAAAVEDKCVDKL